MSRLRSQTGQTAAEYLGIVVVVAAVILAVVGTDLPGTIAGGLKHRVDCIVGGGCPATAGDPASTTPVSANAAPSTPQPSGLPTSGAPGTQVAASDPSPVEPGEAEPGEAPVPFPPKDAPSTWTGQASNLPAGGERPYVPPKGTHGKPLKVPAGRRGGKKGYKDANGNVWTWNPPGSPTAHGGPHWDVTHPDGSHTNVGPDGSVTHGPDNFPNNQRPGGGSSDSGDGGSNDYTAEAAAGAGVLATIAGIWLAAKVASPACGPFLPVCAVVL